MTLAERIIERVRERERVGFARYGKPLDPRKDKRNWVRETIEELLDALFYLEAETDRRRERTRKYRASGLGHKKQHNYKVSPKGRAARRRYDTQPRVKETRLWRDRSKYKTEKLKNAIL